MLIVPRPPVECDSLPVGLWSCLPKEMNGCACVAPCTRVYSVHPHRVTTAVAMRHTCVFVWLCVSGCISTDLCAAAVVTRGVFPVLQTLRRRNKKQGNVSSQRCHISIILPFILPAFDPISKAKPVGKERDFFTFLSSRELHPMDFWQIKWPCPVTEEVVMESNSLICHAV